MPNTSVTHLKMLCVQCLKLSRNRVACQRHEALRFRDLRLRKRTRIRHDNLANNSLLYF